ncbi:hypothetical protein [Faecalibacterium sp. I4-3-84]|uniref:hypothetical protein n=1 Tax=Faecalibacterium sp. I4-3-84 TaxID=2929495 RepID=UPI003FA59686
MKNAGKACNNRLYRHIRTFEKIVKNYFVIYFEKLYGVMNDVERRRFIEALISEIQIFPERQPNGQWLKSIKFKLPIIGENMELSLDNDKHVEVVCSMVRFKKH